jgi:hypothetical protein
MIEIKAPIWKSRSIGIADYKIRCGDNLVRITYRDKGGNLLYPNTYNISGDRARTYPIQTIREGVDLRIIPIADLEMVQ